MPAPEPWDSFHGDSPAASRRRTVAERITENPLENSASRDVSFWASCPSIAFAPTGPESRRPLQFAGAVSRRSASSVRYFGRKRRGCLRLFPCGKRPHGLDPPTSCVFELCFAMCGREFSGSSPEENRDQVVGIPSAPWWSGGGRTGLGCFYFTQNGHIDVARAPQIQGSGPPRLREKFLDFFKHFRAASVLERIRTSSELMSSVGGQWRRDEACYVGVDRLRRRGLSREEIAR